MTRSVCYSIINNMHQVQLDCKGVDGTSRFAERISENPGLVRPDIAGAPKISPEPPPDSSLPTRAGVAGNPSVIIRGDMSTCPIERIVVRAHYIRTNEQSQQSIRVVPREALSPRWG